MKKDRLIERRFSELEEKAAEILENKQLNFQARDGTKYFNVDSASVHGWATSVLNLLQRVFEEESAHYRNFHCRYDEFRGHESAFKKCMAIFQAAKEDYEGGYLFNVRALAKADALVDVLEQAEVLKNANYVDIACIMAGIALEIAVKEICAREGVAPGQFNYMNEQLRQAGLYNQAMWEQLKTWYTRRNEAAHGNLGQSTHQDADDMIKGVRRFMADYL
jgi:hypothetical protein